MSGTPEAERFWAKVRPAGDCWIWQAGTNGWGYGVFTAGSRTDGTRQRVVAHRWAYEHLVAEIPAGLDLDHLCRRRNCVNPWHLEPVTRQVNTLRGIGPSAENARRETCPRGHAFDRIDRRGTRACRTCAAAHERARRARIKAAK